MILKAGDMLPGFFLPGQDDLKMKIP